MNFGKMEIIIIAMGLSTTVMFILHLIKKINIKIKYNKGVKRTNEIMQLVDNKDVQFILINLDTEPERVKDTENHIGLNIDGKLYTDKNSYFLQKDGKIYIIGKREDYLIAVMGGFIR